MAPASKFMFWYAVMGIFIGASILVTFGRHGAWHAASWGAVSAVYAGLTATALRLLPKRAHDPATVFLSTAGIFVGLAGAAASTAAFVAYLVAGAQRHDPLNMTSFWCGAVWALMTLKWSGTLTALAVREGVFTAAHEGVGWLLLVAALLELLSGGSLVVAAHHLTWPASVYGICAAATGGVAMWALAALWRGYHVDECVLGSWLAMGGATLLAGVGGMAYYVAKGLLQTDEEKQHCSWDDVCPFIYAAWPALAAYTAILLLAVCPMVRACIFRSGYTPLNTH